jgi:hypothetical protein
LALEGQNVFRVAHGGKQPFRQILPCSGNWHLEATGPTHHKPTADQTPNKTGQLPTEVTRTPNPVVVDALNVPESEIAAALHSATCFSKVRPAQFSGRLYMNRFRAASELFTVQQHEAGWNPSSSSSASVPQGGGRNDAFEDWNERELSDDERWQMLETGGPKGNFAIFLSNTNSNPVQYLTRLLPVATFQLPSDK